jgi:hypothetical protein
LDCLIIILGIRQNTRRGKSLPAVPVFQKVEEEKPLQGEFETGQRVEELIHGKFEMSSSS